MDNTISYLERSRLNKLFKEAVDYPVVAVYARSGYGKTRAVSSFLQEYEAEKTWIQITERDNITRRFWENLTHAISQNRPKAGRHLQEIGFPDTDEKFAKFESMTSDSATVPGRQIVVFDDFHMLQNHEILSFFDRAVSHLPPRFTIILISRNMPEINTVGLMLQERIFTIGEEALCFTENEISDYFDLLSFPVPRQDIRDIYDDTKGWAFALNLIGRSLKSGARYKRYALDAMKANIYKLIEAEILSKISEPLRRFLLRISLIDHLAAGLIRKLANEDAFIKEMEGLNAYIRYDSFLDAYVIHHLFLDCMRQHQYILSVDEKKETYQKAAEWCENNDYQADALSYYEKSGDYDAIMRMVYCFDGQVPADLARYTTEIFDRIPADVTQSHPLFPCMDLKLKIGLGLIEEAFILAGNYAIEYEARPESPEKNRALLGIYYVWGLLRMIMCPHTNTYDFDEYFKKMGEYGDKSPFKEYGPSTNQSVGAWAVIVGDSGADAPEAFIEAVSRSIPYVSGSLGGNMYGFDDLARGELCYYRYEIDDAKKHLKQALDKARSQKQYDIQSRALLYLMLIAFSLGDFSAADKNLKSIEELLDEKDYVVRHMAYDIACGLYYSALKQPEKIPAWLKGDFSIYAHPVLLENYANRVRVLYHYHTRKYSMLLAFYNIEYKRQPALLGKIEMNAVAALALYQLKRRDDALVILQEAYTLAEPNKIVAPFIKHGKDMRTLTASALKDESCTIPKAWLENINRKASAFAKRQSFMLSEYKAANNIIDEVKLTNREMEILRDLSQGLSRTEIAASQNISANTVKMSVNIIYEKLGANNYADLILKAADLKII